MQTALSALLYDVGNVGCRNKAGAWPSLAPRLSQARIARIAGLLSTHGIPIADDRRKGPLCARTVTPLTKPPTRWIDVPSPVKSVEFNR